MDEEGLLAHQFPAGIKELCLAVFFGMVVLGMDSPALAHADIAGAEPVPAEAPATAEVASPTADDSENQEGLPKTRDRKRARRMKNLRKPLRKRWPITS